MNEEEKKAIEYLKYLNKNLDFNKTGYVYGNETLETVLNLIEKKDKIIDLMAEKLKQLREASLDDCFIPRSYRDIDDCVRTTCEDCIKEYFERKVENGN